MKTFKIILVPVVVLLLTTMTWSDYYYSKLERDYTMVTDSVLIDGIVADVKIHWKHTYLKMGNGKQLHVQPVQSEYQGAPFHEIVATGNSIYKDRNSDVIELAKDGQEFMFVIRELVSER